jgi:hypothetical protein
LGVSKLMLLSLVPRLEYFQTSLCLDVAEL